MDGASDSTELIYRFEEPVFDPGDPVARNLAAMIAHLVAFVEDLKQLSLEEIHHRKL